MSDLWVSVCKALGGQGVLCVDDLSSKLQNARVKGERVGYKGPLSNVPVTELLCPTP